VGELMRKRVCRGCSIERSTLGVAPANETPPCPVPPLGPYTSSASSPGLPLARHRHGRIRLCPRRSARTGKARADV